MTRKIRIGSTIAAIVLVAAVLCVGIYAATQVAINGSGNVTLEAKDVAATVSGTKQTTGEESPTSLGESIVIAKDDDGADKTMTLGDIKFTSVNDSCTIVLTVANGFDDKENNNVNAVLTVDVHENAGYAVKVNESEYVGAVTLATNGDNAAIFTIVISVADNADEEGFDAQSFGFTLTLTKAA